MILHELHKKMGKVFYVFFTQGPVVFYKKFKTYYFLKKQIKYNQSIINTSLKKEPQEIQPKIESDTRHELENYTKHELESDTQLKLVYNTQPELKYASEIIISRFLHTKRIPTTLAYDTKLRLNIITDTIDENYLFGGVATSLIFATYLAMRLNTQLRIITRYPNSKIESYWRICQFHKINMTKDVVLLTFEHNDEESKLDVSTKDIFLSTSWWSSYVVKAINLNNYYFYILQEYEAIFYPFGDEQVMAEEIFNDEQCIPILNTTTLYEYYTWKKYKRILETNLYFEPAFPKHVYKANNNAFQEKEKFRLFFYARPNTDRNLYYTGLRLINTAIDEGIINTDKWEIIFAGNDIPPFKFSNNISPTIVGKLTIDKYVELATSIDLAICLLYAPCPGYLPMDFASVGAIVLTNKCLNKQDLNYSNNIIVADTTQKGLLKGLESAIALSKNFKQRERNYNANRINTSWDNSFIEICNKLAIYVKNNDNR